MNTDILTVKQFQDLANIKRLLDSLTVIKADKRRKDHKKDYFDVVCAFDIETSIMYTEESVSDLLGNLVTDYNGDVITERRPHSFLYIWQCQIGDMFTIIGRNWDEYTEFLTTLKRVQKAYWKTQGLTDKPPYFVFYVHNLAYEFQFLQGIYTFEPDDVFLRDIRKPIYARYGHLIEYRCSYIHSNMSLAKFAENMGTEIRKLDGDEFNYMKMRYPWTELTDRELQYCVNDVRCLVQAIQIELTRDGDNLATIPLTSTGYVRRDVKKALVKQRYSIQCMLPDLDTYKLLRRCFRGGDTHANRYRVGQIQAAGESVDIESSYPFACLTGMFPMGPFRKLPENETTLEYAIMLIGKGNALIADYHFTGLELKDFREPFPYLPIAKCKAINAELDNGRVLSADIVTTALTEIDLEIVLEQYTFTSVTIHNARTAIKAPLPKRFRDVIIDYYVKKTALKGVKGSEYEYMKAKNKLNSTYGMTAQQPVHPLIQYLHELEEMYHVKLLNDEDAQKELDKAHFPYQWGVYCTAIARRNLRRGLQLIPVDENGVSRAIYCDTDSIKYTGPHIDFTELNEQIKIDSTRVGATALNRAGERHYMGIWDFDGRFKRFITQGAKRYAYEDDNGELHITVSGVTDKTCTDKLSSDYGKKWKNIELGKLENFKEGMLWKEAGGTAAVYNDHDNFIWTVPGTGKPIAITPNVCIVESTYKLTMETEYKATLDKAILWLKWVRMHNRKDYK